MLGIMKRTTLAMLACLVFWSVSGYAQEIPSDYQEVLKSLDRKGDFKDAVLKVNIPRNDLKMTVQGISTPTPFGFGGWIAFTKTTDGNEVMMGDLVLLQDEVNPVMSALLDNGIDVTALHNHFLWDDPHVFYMHVHGMGKAVDLARRVKPAFDLIGHVKPTAVTPAATGGAAIDTAKIVQIVGHSGEQSGAVYKITVGRNDIAMKDHGAAINARMGLNTWAACYYGIFLCAIEGSPRVQAHAGVDRGAVVLHRNVVPSNRDFVNCARLLTSVPHNLSDLRGVNRRTTPRGRGYSGWLHVADQIESRLHSTREVSRFSHSMNVQVEHVWVIPEEMIVQGS